MRAYTIHFICTCITKLVLASYQCAGVSYTPALQSLYWPFSHTEGVDILLLRLVLESQMKEQYMEEQQNCVVYCKV